MAGDEVVAGGSKPWTAAFQVPDAMQQTTVEEVAHGACDLFGKGAFKTGPEVLPPRAGQQEGEAFGRGSFGERLAEGCEVALEAAEIDGL